MAEMFLPKQNIFIIMMTITLVPGVFLGIFVRVCRERAARKPRKLNGVRNSLSKSSVSGLLI